MHFDVYATLAGTDSLCPYSDLCIAFVVASALWPPGNNSNKAQQISSDLTN